MLILHKTTRFTIKKLSNYVCCLFNIIRKELIYLYLTYKEKNDYSGSKLKMYNCNCIFIHIIQKKVVICYSI